MGDLIGSPFQACGGEGMKVGANQSRRTPRQTKPPLSAHIMQLQASRNGHSQCEGPIRMGSRSLRPTGFKDLYPTTRRLGLPLYHLPKLESRRFFITIVEPTRTISFASKLVRSNQGLAASVSPEASTALIGPLSCTPKAYATVTTPKPRTLHNV